MKYSSKTRLRIKESSMKAHLTRTVVTLATGCWFLALGGPSLAGPIADKNLETAVRAVLQEPKADLTDEKLNNVFVLEAAGKEIKSLAGLEKCKNLALL